MAIKPGLYQWRIYGNANPAHQIIQSFKFGLGYAGEYVYIGPSTRSVRYVGVRSDAQMYFGTKALFP